MTFARSAQSCPADFADCFISHGWRGVERFFGARTSVLLKWIEICGGEELHARRRDHLVNLKKGSRRG